ncbi:MAG: hypothetical protein IKF46_08310 [Erysipelotrichaceae bacterium]|nr:hypothetical protein [Erysipelotrichaceae bacterium]
MKEVYTVLVKRDGDMFLVYVPDIDQMTQGTDMYNAMVMARDLLGLYSLDNELPVPSSIDEGRVIAREKADPNLDNFTISDGTAIFVDIDTVEYQRKLNTKSIRRNVSLPMWLNDKADAAGINVSRVLQDALIEKLG